MRYRILCKSLETDVSGPSVLWMDKTRPGMLLAVARRHGGGAADRHPHGPHARRMPSWTIVLSELARDCPMPAPSTGTIEVPGDIQPQPTDDPPPRDTLEPGDPD